MTSTDTRQDSSTNWCQHCHHVNPEAFVTCESCGDWLNEEVLYA